MVFVPVIVPPPQASARARDLARRLQDAIATFERQYPGTSPGDIRQAVRLATGGPGGSRRAPRAAMAILAGAISLAVGMFALIAERSGGLGGEGSPAIPWVVFGVVAGLAGVMIALRRMR
jgi:hypothetical protein